MWARDFIAGALFLSFVGVAVRAQTTTAESSSIGVRTSLATAADLSAVYPTSTFPAGTREIFAAVSLGRKSTLTKISSKWIAVDVGGAAPPHLTIASADTDVTKADRARLRYAQAKPMPPGSYRLEITADGAPIASTDFRIDPPAANAQPAAAKIEDLLPLKIGHVWRYDFTQESSGSPTLRARVTQKLASNDYRGPKIETRRDNKLVMQEWWLLDDKGLFAAQRQVGDDSATILDPPQLLWPGASASSSPIAWSYQPKHAATADTCRMWGPLPIDTPMGQRQGYVVLCEQKGGQSKMTTERHWVPGIGMTREIVVNAIKDQLLSRQDMELIAVGEE